MKCDLSGAVTLMAAFRVFLFLCIVGWASSCGLPWGTQDCSLITQDYAVVAAHKIDKCLSIGTTFFDGSPNDQGIVQGPVQYQSIQPPDGANWKFKNGFSVGPSRFDFNQFAQIARTAQA